MSVFFTLFKLRIGYVLFLVGFTDCLASQQTMYDANIFKDFKCITCPDYSTSRQIKQNGLLKSEEYILLEAQLS